MQLQFKNDVLHIVDSVHLSEDRKYITKILIA